MRDKRGQNQGDLREALVRPFEEAYAGEKARIKDAIRAGQAAAMVQMDALGRSRNMRKRTKQKRDRDGVCKRPDGFYISYQDAQGRRRQKKLRGVISLTEAKRQRNLELAKVTEAIATGKSTPSDETFAQVIPEYLEYQQARLTPRAYARTEGILKKHLIPLFGTMRLDRIHKPDVIAFVTHRSVAVRKKARSKATSKPIAAATVLKELNVLRHVFNWALEQELVRMNPCDRVRGPKAAPGRVRYLQPRELRAVIESSPVWLRPVVALLALTGMRRGEVLGLRWLDVDRAGGKIVLPRSKNNEGRIVWLNQFACQVLDAIPRNGAGPSDRLFPASPQLNPESVSLQFLRACRRIGVDDFKLHDLRHTAASWMAMGGADIHLVAQLLGHRDLRMAKRYRHLSPEYLQGAARTLDVPFGPELQKLSLLNGKASHDGNTMQQENGTKLTQSLAS
jgi:integrase